MENDVLKNKIAPWQEKGRWYKITLDSNRTSFSINKTESDINCTLSALNNINGIRVFGETLEGFKTINDVVVKLKLNNSISAGVNLSTPAFTIYGLTSGFYTIRILFPAADCDKLVLYIHSDDSLM